MGLRSVPSHHCLPPCFLLPSALSLRRPNPSSDDFHCPIDDPSAHSLPPEINRTVSHPDLCLSVIDLNHSTTPFPPYFSILRIFLSLCSPFFFCLDTIVTTLFVEVPSCAYIIVKRSCESCRALLIRSFFPVLLITPSPSFLALGAGFSSFLLASPPSFNDQLRQRLFSLTSPEDEG